METRCGHMFSAGKKASVTTAISGKQTSSATSMVITTPARGDCFRDSGRLDSDDGVLMGEEALGMQCKEGSQSPLIQGCYKPRMPPAEENRREQNSAEFMLDRKLEVCN